MHVPIRYRSKLGDATSLNSEPVSKQGASSFALSRSMPDSCYVRQKMYNLINIVGNMVLI